MCLALTSSPPFPSPFEFRCGELVGEGERGRPFPLPFLLGSCQNAHASPDEHWPVVIHWMQFPLSRGWYWNCSCLFFSLSLCSELQLHVCPRLDFLLRNENLCFSAWDVFGPSTLICNNHTYFLSSNVVSWAKTCDKYLNSSDFSTCTLYSPLAVSRSVSDCWKYFVPLFVEGLTAVVLLLDVWTISSIQDGISVATNFEDVVDHTSNLFASKLHLIRLSFAFCFGDLFLEVSCKDFTESACNLEIKILEVRNWSSCCCGEGVAQISVTL